MKREQIINLTGSAKYDRYIFQRILQTISRFPISCKQLHFVTAEDEQVHRFEVTLAGDAQMLRQAIRKIERLEHVMVTEQPSNPSVPHEESRNDTKM